MSSKHSTFYDSKKGKKLIYTTIKNTEFHKQLRENFKGRTYEHSPDAKLYFCVGIPLDAPLTIIKEVK